MKLTSLRLSALCFVTAWLLAGCSGNKPRPDQILLMPAPGVYEEGRIDPFTDNDPISRGVEPGILYATDRAPAGPDNKKFRFFTYDRSNKLHLGRADIRLGIDEDMTWEEARRISLLKNRTEKYPLEVSDIEDFGVLESTIRFSDEETRRSPEPGRLFFAAIDRRLEASQSKDVYIYVHGYKVNFENPILVAAELWHYLGYNGAFIAYSWPTKASTFAYFADLDNAVNSARYLRTLILDVAGNTEAERIHVIGYSAGTRLVSRMLADIGLYGMTLDQQEIAANVSLGNVILVGSDVDQDILAGYLYDGMLRVSTALTLYVSENDSALSFSSRMFRGRERAGQLLERREFSEREKSYFDANPQLRIIDVSYAEGSTDGNGHSYFRTSPWVSSDILMTLLYDLSPEDRGLELDEQMPIWEFPPDYVERLRNSLLEVNPAFGGSDPVPSP